MSGDMSIDQRLTTLEIEHALMRDQIAELQRNLTGNWPTPPKPRLVMSWPAGDITRRTLEPWFDATGYGTLYNGGKAYHTGHDLNLSGYGDSGARVVAVADGEIVFSGSIVGWQGWVTVVRHVLEDGRLFWTRYAHIKGVSLNGLRVKRGDLLGYIADYTPAGKQGDHLHIDGSWKDLGKAPGDWPGLDLQRLRVDYFDLIKMIEERLP